LLGCLFACDFIASFSETRVSLAGWTLRTNKICNRKNA